MTERQDERAADRVLATVLFTDLVESTAQAAEMGPRWNELLRQHNSAIRRELARFRGQEIDTAGDGFFASGFDGPARAIRCGCAIRDAIAVLGLGVRVGLHTGECDVVDAKLSGLAVNIGARVAAEADGGEVLGNRHGKGSGRRIRDPVRITRAPGTQGCRRVAAVRCDGRVTQHSGPRLRKNS